MPSLERFAVLLSSQTSTCTSINECRKDLFSRKGQSLEELPPTLDAFKLHVNRAVFQASYCGAQSLLKDLVLPDPNEWGWNISDEGYKLVWTKTLEESKMCQELTQYGCNSEKDCTRQCKCVKASLKCTTLCK